MAVTGVALSPGASHLFSGSRDGVLRLWDVGASRCVGEQSVSRNVVGWPFPLESDVWLSDSNEYSHSLFC